MAVLRHAPRAHHQTRSTPLPHHFYPTLHSQTSSPHAPNINITHLPSIIPHAPESHTIIHHIQSVTRSPEQDSRFSQYLRASNAIGIQKHACAILRSWNQFLHQLRSTHHRTAMHRDQTGRTRRGSTDTYVDESRLYFVPSLSRSADQQDSISPRTNQTIDQVTQHQCYPRNHNSCKRQRHGFRCL